MAFGTPSPYRVTVYDPAYLTLQNGQLILIDQSGSADEGAILLEVSPKPIQTPVPTWRIDGIAMPRNPIQFDIKWDKASVTYEPLADGREIRMQTPYLLRGADITMAWDKADRRTYNFIMQFFNTAYPIATNHTLLLDGISPPKIALVFFDTPEIKMSKDNATRNRLGEGNVRNDITLTLRMGSYFKSFFLVPKNMKTSPLVLANVMAMFGGPTQTAMDSIPIWDGTHYWNQQFPNDGVVNKMLFWNLGTAPWSPTIRINGPFVGMTVASSVDVDGTGQGVAFTWTGPPLIDGQYITFDTKQKRCYLASGSGISEVYSFTLTTVSNGLSFAFFPPLSPGINTLNVTPLDTLPGISSLDFSNNGTERFNYY